MTRNNSDEGRPAIWSEGSQKPPFEPRAFARVALKIGRESVSGILARCGSNAKEIGGDLRAGRLRIPEERLGRTGRFLPSAASAGNAVLGGAGILRRASELAQPNAFANPPKEIDQAYRDLFRAGLSPAGSPALTPSVAGDADPTGAAMTRRSRISDDSDLSDDLASIRDMLRNPQQPQDETVEGQAQGASAPEQGRAAPAARRSLTRRLRHAIGEGAARILGYWMIAFAFPYGAIRAGLAHLNGEDLRKIRKSSD